jgi:hypothetical protein
VHSSDAGLIMYETRSKHSCCPFPNAQKLTLLHTATIHFYDLLLHDEDYNRSRYCIFLYVKFLDGLLTFEGIRSPDSIVLS